MKKHHYVYSSYEEWGREYLGVRSCNCLPEEDTKYFGSFKDKTFFPTEKTILFVCETREEASEIEIKLHNFFDVAVNPEFANKAKATSTGFDRTGVTLTEETKKKLSVAMSGENNPNYGVLNKVHSERMSGENHPLFGVPNSEAQKKAQSERMTGENNPMFGRSGEKNPMFGMSGALHPRSNAIIAIEPDGTQRHFGGICEAARDLGIPQSSLSYHLEIGHVLKCGKFKGWQLLYKNSEDF